MTDERAATKFLSETPTEITFRFVCECEDCDAEGDLTLDKADGMKPFGCPEGCGATYVPWKYNGHWQLKCVVLPCYGRNL
jgi:hypothetical protein